MNKSKKTLLIFIFLLLCGFLYRVYLSSVAYTQLIWDGKIYHDFANEILKGKFIADCCEKNLGYSAFLAPIYFIFGEYNLGAVRLIQIIMDLMTAVLVFLIAKKQFGKRPAWFAFILYIFNPFTASYAGLKMGEILTIFIVTMTAYLLSNTDITKNKRSWLSLGIFLGFLVFVRLQFYYFVFLIPVLLGIFWVKGKRKIQFVVLISLGMLLSVSYSLMANYRNFKVVSIVPPYSRTSSAMYLNFYNDRRYPELMTDFEKMNPQYRQIAQEYFDTPVEQIFIYKKKYQVMLFQKMKTDWPVFVKNTLQNMVWLWDKRNLGYYEDKFYPKDTIYLRVFNITTICLFFFGIGSYVWQKKAKALRNPLFIFTVILFCYMTFLFSLVSNETRHTMSFYSLLYLWAGVGVVKISKFLSALIVLISKKAPISNWIIGI